MLSNGSRVSCMLVKYIATERPSSPWTLSEEVFRTLYIYPCSSDMCPLSSSPAKRRSGIGLLSLSLALSQGSEVTLVFSVFSTASYSPFWVLGMQVHTTMPGSCTAGVEHRAPCTPCKHCANWATSPALWTLGWQKASAIPFLVWSWLNIDRALSFPTVDISGYCPRQWCRNNCQRFEYCDVPDGSTLTHWLYEAGINPTLQKRNLKFRSWATGQGHIHPKWLNWKATPTQSVPAPKLHNTNEKAHRPTGLHLGFCTYCHPLIRIVSKKLLHLTNCTHITDLHTFLSSIQLALIFFIHFCVCVSCVYVCSHVSGHKCKWECICTCVLCIQVETGRWHQVFPPSLSTLYIGSGSLPRSGAHPLGSSS